MLILRRFRPDPPLTLRRFGPDARLAQLAERAAGAPLPQVIGPPGPQGATGAQGPEGTPRRFDFSNAATWTAEHDLGRSPAVLVYLASGERVLADITSTPINVTVVHAAAQSGFILLI